MLVSALASLLVFSFKSASTSKSLQRTPSQHVPAMPLFNNHTTWKDYLTFLSDETLISFTDVVKCGNRNFSLFRFARGVIPSFKMQNGELMTDHVDVAAFPSCKDKYNWVNMRTFVHKIPVPSGLSPRQSRTISSYQMIHYYAMNVAWWNEKAAKVEARVCSVIEIAVKLPSDGNAKQTICTINPK